MSAFRRFSSRIGAKVRRNQFRILAGWERLEERSLLAAFTPGNFAVYRVGNGSRDLADSGNSVFVDEYTPAGSLVQSIPMAADTVNPGNSNTLVSNGLLASEGMLTLATDGRSLAVPGYSTTGTLNYNVTTRVVGLVDVAGSVDLSTTGLFNQDHNFRGAVRDGNRIYTSGGVGGVVMITKGTSSGRTDIALIPAQTRSVFIFNSQLYTSSSASSFRVSSVGTGVPTTSGQTTTNLPGFPTTGSPYQFFFADLDAAVAGVDTLYVADDAANGGEIQKYSLNGGTWSAQGAIRAAAVRGLTGFVNGGSVTLFAATGSNQQATGGGSLYTFTDTTGYNATVSGTATTIATAGAKTAFRGVAMAPDDGVGAIGNVDSDHGYATGEEAIAIASSATFSDQSSFKGGSLTIGYSSGGTNNDTLVIASGDGLVASSGALFYDGIQIGSYPTSGSGSGLAGNELTVSFNAVLSSNPVTAAAVQALLRKITFGTSPGAAGGDRLIELRVRQNDGEFATALTTVTVTISNQAPSVSDAAITADEDQAKNISLLGSDPDGDALTYTVTSGPAHGTLSGTAPNLIYTPDANYHGADSFKFNVNDGALDSSEATISITVNAINDAPSADNDSLTTDEDAALSVALSGSDIDGDAIRYVVTSLPAHGQLSGTAPDLTYTPHADFHGTDSFSFKVNDGALDSSEATISITIAPKNDVPTAGSASTNTDEDTPLELALIGSDVDGDVLTYIITSDPAHGTLSGEAPNLVYTPDADYEGSDSFAFKVNDGAKDSALATISITIEPSNDAPTASGDSAETDEDSAVNVTLTGSDIDGDTLSFLVSDLPDHGTLSGAAPNLTYTPHADFHGTDSFSFKVNDGSADSQEAVFSIEVAAVNDAPVATAGSKSTAEDTPSQVLLAGGDVDGDSLTYVIVTQPAHGTLSGDAPNLVYTPDADYHGPDSFTFKVNDGFEASAEARIDIAVNSVNDEPTLLVTRPALRPVNEDAVSPPWNFVSDLLVGAFSDPDAGTQAGIVVAGLSLHIRVQYSLNRGVEWISIPRNTSSTQAIVLPGSAVLRVFPEANFNGTAKLYYRAWDRSNGLAAGSTVNLAGQLAEGKPYSLAYDYGAITVLPVNDAPVLKPTAPALKTISQGTTSPYVMKLATLLQGRVSDIDGAGKGIAVAWAGGQSVGTWQYSLGNGVWIAIGPASSTAARLIPAAASIRFLPEPAFHGEVKLHYRAWDQTQGTAGGVLDLTRNTGGRTSISREYDHATQKVNMTPVLRQSDTAPHHYALDSRAVHFMWGAKFDNPTTLTDVDSPDFATGVLSVHTALGRRTGDRLEVSWNFCISGTAVLFKTTQIGTITSNGKDGSDLRIVFNSNATLDLVRRLINSLQFRTVNGIAATRKFEVRVWDGDGGASNTLVRTVGAD